MKSKFLIFPVLLLLLCNCEENEQRMDERSKIKTVISTKLTESDIRIDTINIHGNLHEILLRQDARDPGWKTGMGFGGIMHSPECWCLKDSTSK